MPRADAATNFPSSFLHTTAAALSSALCLILHPHGTPATLSIVDHQWRRFSSEIYLLMNTCVDSRELNSFSCIACLLAHQIDHKITKVHSVSISFTKVLAPSPPTYSPVLPIQHPSHFQVNFPPPMQFAAQGMQQQQPWQNPPHPPTGQWPPQFCPPQPQ